MKQRKLLSLLIALAMTLAFLPAALAETEGVPGGATFVDGEQPLDQADNVAMVGEIGYTTLQAAIDAAIKAGGTQTVKLIANVTESVVVSKVFSLKDNNSVEVILDLAGCRKNAYWQRRFRYYCEALQQHECYADAYY